MTEKELNDAIMEKLKEIRAMLEANGGVQHLSMSICDDGSIMFFNKHCMDGWEGITIDGYLRGDE